MGLVNRQGVLLPGAQRSDAPGKTTTTVVPMLSGQAR
jgi:hypothetical protein